MSEPVLKLAVLISGNGSNLQAIIDAIHAGSLNAKVELVISNKADAYGLERAKAANIHTVIADDKLAFEQQIIDTLEQQPVDLIVLAGFMKILSEGFVNRYLGKMINIHPSLLPKYQGLHTHQRVLEAGETEHGATVHYVTPELDSGPVILQAKVAVHHGDNADTLKQRVHKVEHLLYPEAIQRIASNEVSFSNGSVLYAGIPVENDQLIFNTPELN